ncbi:MAG: hypothetical protein V4773_15950 [Verrucomicrobiota bacterium]
MRPVARFVLALCLAATSARLAAAPSATTLTTELRATITGAIGQPPASATPFPTLGPALADYASHTGHDPARYESFVAAARRILAGEPATQQSPDRTALQLTQTANALLAALPADTALPTAATDPATLEARLTAHLARFHAQRVIAAVHYSLFRRGLRLAELVAATYREKSAVANYRDLVALATAARHPAAPALQAELKQLELHFKELEEQCCPPSEAIMKEKVWQPATAL